LAASSAVHALPVSRFERAIDCYAGVQYDFRFEGNTFDNPLGFNPVYLNGASAADYVALYLSDVANANGDLRNYVINNLFKGVTTVLLLASAPSAPTSLNGFDLVENSMGGPFQAGPTTFNGRCVNAGGCYVESFSNIGPLAAPTNW
jgi:hypothetical protein